MKKYTAGVLRFLCRNVVWQGAEGVGGLRTPVCQQRQNVAISIVTGPSSATVGNTFFPLLFR